MYIERIEDVYFDKHNWKTKEIGEQEYGAVGISAFGRCYSAADKIFVIVAHY